MAKAKLNEKILNQVKKMMDNGLIEVAVNMLKNIGYKVFAYKWYCQDCYKYHTVIEILDNNFNVVFKYKILDK